MKIVSIVLFILINIASNAQDSTYFNKLIFPYLNATNPISAVIKQDSGFLLSMLSYDTIQKICIIKVNKQGSTLDKNCWSVNSTSSIYQYPGNSFIKTMDSNYVLATIRMDTSGVILGLLLKVDPQTLDTLWTRTYTHPDTAASLLAGATIFNAFTAIRQTYDGGFIISGMYNPGCVQNADRKAYLLKVDSAGGVEWINKYNTDGFFDIEQASDSGFYFPAFLNHQAEVFKTDKYGNINWHIVVNSNSVRGYPMDLELLDSNILYVTSRFMYDITYYNSGITLAKVNIQSQSVQWEKNYILFKNFECQSLHQSMGIDILPSGDIIISGTSQMPNPATSQGIAHKGVIMKLNSNGDSLWARWHGHGLFEDDCQINDIILTDDGGFLAVGWQWHNNGALFYQNAWLLKMDSMGCDTAGCDVYDAIAQVQIRPKLNMKLYPNPTSDYFRIKADKIDNLHNLQLIITDMQGRTIRKIEFDSKVNQMIDVSALSIGIYSVSLFSGSLLLEVKQLNIVR